MYVHNNECIYLLIFFESALSSTLYDAPACVNESPLNVLRRRPWHWWHRGRPPFLSMSLASVRDGSPHIALRQQLSCRGRDLLPIVSECAARYRM